ncbi:MAG: hydroxymethylglutaryl-CoA lyase [Aeromonas sobria]|uniref:hydroxymethylglutaryl-CoA lyase n=1 Tax=Aeromonas sobria TaxID=646 RepID=UPI003F34B031
MDAMHSMSDQQITVADVFPRDGIQILDQIISTDDKKRYLKTLVDVGVKDIEITSFVNPKVMPQFYDTKEVAAYALELAKEHDLVLSALAPNLRGAQNLYEAGLRNMNYVVSVSETHNLKNINRTVKQSIDDLKIIREQLPDLNIRVDFATVFGCPFDGYVPTEKLIDLIHQVHALGIREIVLCDTIGVANPYQVRAILHKVMALYDDVEYSLHMHNTHGMAIANIYQGVLFGVKRFESAMGGLGGCPFAPGAAGNVATEDVVNLLHRMGYQTHIDLEALLVGLKEVDTKIQNKVNSQLFKARTYSEFNFYQGE